jgi:hypothetical protein
MVQKDKLHFLYNGHIDNIKLDDKKGKHATWNKKAKKTVIMYTTIDKMGKMTRTPFVNAKNIDLITRPKVCEQISESQFILYGERGSKKYKFAMITL